MAARRSAARALDPTPEGPPPVVPVDPTPRGAAGSAGRRRGTDPVRASLELDRLIHERIRLAIVSALAVHERLTFGELKEATGATDGNLSVHARKLEQAGYLACRKGFSGRVPRTEYRLTSTGRRALERYLAHMERIIQATRSD